MVRLSCFAGTLETGIRTNKPTRIVYSSQLPVGLMLHDPACRQTVVGRTRISAADGEAGTLTYRGYDIAELAESSTFLEVAFLLINGELPTAVWPRPLRRARCVAPLISAARYSILSCSLGRGGAVGAQNQAPHLRVHRGTAANGDLALRLAPHGHALGVRGPRPAAFYMPSKRLTSRAEFTQ